MTTGGRKKFPRLAPHGAVHKASEQSKPMYAFIFGSVIGVFLVAGAARRWRSKMYANFRAVSLGVHTILAALLFSHVGPLWTAFVYLHITLFVQSLALIRPKMRPFAYRALVSIPASFFAAGTFLALPWAVVAAAGVEPWGLWIPYLLALVGMVQSLTTRVDEVDVVVSDGQASPAVRRHRPASLRTERPLRVFQISDPHLGPFMSVHRLRRICERAVRREPDLVVLTGDFLTMESQSDPGLLEKALEPLSELHGRVFACFGNHDHEAPQTVRRGLEAVGARLLVDAAAPVETAAGPVEIIGMDFVWRNRAAHLQAVCKKFPRRPGVLRIVLLHDPGAFKHLPEGEADLVLSGHTHGGQVGFVSLGLPWTMLRFLMKAPDHGLWARGTDRLYVHRGTGHYGFPLRLGVPAEESVLRIHAAEPVETSPPDSPLHEPAAG
jgi:predicted MPP superfamily phosphohydrolase/drug/metabolite transporter superfamily protein YnfA